MQTAVRERFESILGLGGPLEWRERPAPECISCGVVEVDRAIGGLPRGSLTEIFGPASSGRTSLLFSILAESAERGEVCALVDAEDAFDPISAAAAGVRLDRLLWVRCRHNAEHALRAVDLLVQGGGFGVVALDLGDTPPVTARRISLTSWFRLRRAVEHTPAVMVALARQSNAKTCASLMLELGAGDRGSGTGGREWKLGASTRAEKSAGPFLLSEEMHFPKTDAVRQIPGFQLPAPARKTSGRPAQPLAPELCARFFVTRRKPGVAAGALFHACAVE